MNTLKLALAALLFATSAAATPYTIDRGDGVHIPNPDYHPEPVPAPSPKAERSDPVSLHKHTQQVYICKRTGLRYLDKAEALRACKPVVKRKVVKARKAVCK